MLTFYEGYSITGIKYILIVYCFILFFITIVLGSKGIIITFWVNM